MTRPHSGRFPAALLALLSLAACGTHRSAIHTTPDPAASDSAAMAKARADSARLPYTDADVRFMSSMIGHHSQAIVMAGWAPSHGASRSIQTLAARIVNAQLDEIATMQQWLTDRSKPVPRPDTAGTTMGGMHHHGMLMPGMLTQPQMEELDRAQGPAFDRLFLTSMIQHHKGAVQMVKELFGSYGAGQDETVFKFASDVNVDQSTEIARMETMLKTLPPSPNPQ